MDTNTILLLFLLVVGLIGYKIVAGNKGKKLPTGKRVRKNRKLDKQLTEGRYAEAAMDALDAGRYEEAIDYYLRARNPARAAQVAAQIGDSRRAAELYEKADMVDRAPITTSSPA